MPVILCIFLKQKGLWDMVYLKSSVMNNNYVARSSKNSSVDMESS